MCGYDKGEEGTRFRLTDRRGCAGAGGDEALSSVFTAAYRSMRMVGRREERVATKREGGCLPAGGRGLDRRRPSGSRIRSRRRALAARLLGHATHLRQVKQPCPGHAREGLEARKISMMYSDQTLRGLHRPTGCRSLTQTVQALLAHPGCLFALLTGGGAPGKVAR